MSFNHINATCQTTPTPLFIAKQTAMRQTPITVYNGHSASIFVGDSTITTSGATIGRTIPAATSQTFYVCGGDTIYGISAAQSAAGAIVITYSA
jgi:hypothetical protein